MGRGSLRIYLGAAPGVGKTVAMLDEAHRRLSRGTDVVVGYVETHDRPHTAAMLEGLEVLPRRTVEYRGSRLTELDTAVAERARAAGLEPGTAPADALTASGSGLDPHVSPAYAAAQVERVAAARGLDVSRVRSLVAAHTQGREAGFLGQPRVDVLELNLALARLTAPSAG